MPDRPLPRDIPGELNKMLERITNLERRRPEIPVFPDIPDQQSGGPYTITVAAKDTIETLKERADFVCDGVDDDLTIYEAQVALFANGYGGIIQLMPGKYIPGYMIQIDLHVLLMGHQGAGTPAYSALAGFDVVIDGSGLSVANSPVVFVSGSIENVGVIYDGASGAHGIHNNNGYTRGCSVESSTGTGAGASINMDDAYEVSGCAVEGDIRCTGGAGRFPQILRNSVGTEIVLDGVSGAVVRGNVPNGAFSGQIDVIDSSECIICDNWVTNIFAESSSELIINNNHVTETIQVDSSSEIALVGNQVEENGGDLSMIFTNSSHVSLTGNQLEGQIQVFGSSAFVISSNVWDPNGEPTLSGLLLNDSNDCNILGNYIEQMNIGVELENGSDRNNIQTNKIRTVSALTPAISITSADCDDNFVTNNDMFGTAGLNDAGTGTNTTPGNRT